MNTATQQDAYIPDNSDIARYYENRINDILNTISNMRHNLVDLDMTDEIGHEVWHSLAGHPLLNSKNLAYRAIAQMEILAKDIDYIIENGAI